MFLEEIPLKFIHTILNIDLKCEKRMAFCISLELIKYRLQKYFIAVTCSALNLQHGSIDYNGAMQVGGRYAVSTVASFSCSRGFNLAGSSSRRCETSGTWTQTTPTCNQSKQQNIIINLYV